MEVVFVYITGPLLREFISQVDSCYKGPVTQTFDIYFDVSLNKLLYKQSS